MHADVRGENTIKFLEMLNMGRVEATRDEALHAVEEEEEEEKNVVKEEEEENNNKEAVEEVVWDTTDQGCESPKVCKVSCLFH